jgi:hypothetical protein
MRRAFRSKQSEGYGGERRIRYSRKEDMQEGERDISLQKFFNWLVQVTSCLPIQFRSSLFHA